MLAFLAGLVLGSGFDTPITIEKKDVPLPDLLAQIGRSANLQITLAKEGMNLKVSVFVDGMPAKDLLRQVASTLDLDPVFDGQKCSLNFGRDKRLAYDRYYELERVEWSKPAMAKLYALARMASYPFGSTPGPERFGDALDQWAAKKATSPAYYAAGLSWKIAHAESPSFDDASYPLDDNEFPRLVFVDDPLPRAQTEAFSPLPFTCIDPGSRKIQGTLSSYFTSTSTGELIVRGITSGGEPDPFLERPFLHSRPVSELAKTKFARDLAAWENGVKGVPKSILDSNTKKVDQPPDPGYFGGGISLSEKLEFVHRSTGLPIISTAFRTPTLEPRYPEGGTVGDHLNHLAVKEEVFLRFSGGALLVRHPAYWIFMGSEPNESVLREAEVLAEKRPLSIREYMLTALAFQHYDHLPSWMPSEGHIPPFARLVKGRGILLRFDPEPLQRALPPLIALGHLNDKEAEVFFSQAKLAGTQYDSVVRTAFTNRPFTPSELRNDVDIRGYSANRPHYLVANAPVWPTELTTECITPLERSNVGNFAGPAKKAEFIWLATSGDEYQLCVGWQNRAVATYSFHIHDKPRQPDHDG